MTKTRLYKGNFPDPEFYRYIVSYRDWKAYAARKVTDGGIRVKLVSMVSAEKAKTETEYPF